MVRRAVPPVRSDANPNIAVARPGPGASLRANVVANYASQAYVVLAGIIMMPLYLSRMGSEAYGLIGFFTLMNAWFQILDAGLSLTLARESARYRGGVIDAATLYGLVVTLEFFFSGVAALGAVLIVSGAHFIATSWLNVEKLPVEEVAQAVLLMGLTVPLQWVTGLYRGILNGFERQVWLALFNTVIATLRFGGAAIVLLFINPGPLVFFAYQLTISILELLVLVVMGRRILPIVARKSRRALRWIEVRELLRFSGSLAFAVVVWVLVTQVDKLVLSKILPLAEYGTYTLAVVAAGGVLLIGGPIAQALLPHLTKLAAEGAWNDVIKLYRNGTQFVCIITVPTALVLAFFARPVLYAWTGNAAAANSAGPILVLYALGNGIMTLGAFPYYLQYARGDLRLHVFGNLILMVLLVPSLFVAASRYGALGAGYAWLTMNAIYVAAWIPWVHHRIAPGLHGPWLARDILPIVAAAALTAWFLSLWIVWPINRLAIVALLAVAGGAVAAAAAAASSVARNWVRSALMLARVRARAASI